MIRRVRHTLAILALAAALLPVSTVAVPADRVDDSVSEERVTLLRLLNSESVDKQTRAVRLIGTYAHTGRYDDEFFRLLVTPLHGLVAQGETEALRIMAVSALYSIGTDRAIRGLELQVDRIQPARVQKLTRYAIAEYEADRAAVQETGLK